MPHPGARPNRNDTRPPPSYSTYQWPPQNFAPAPPQQPLRSLFDSTPNYGSAIPDVPSPKPRSSSVHISFRKRSLFLLGLGIIVGIAIGYMLELPLDSSLRQHQRAKWDIDKKNHQMWLQNMMLEKNKWLEDRREREERDRLEEEDRVRREKMYRGAIEWRDFQRGRCLRYKTRDYQAILANVPIGFNAMDECMNKTMHINGRDLVPARCEDQGYCGKAIGHWEVDFDEPACTPFFSYISDKGCSGAKRRYDGRLENIQEWETWTTVCATMSASYGDVYLGPGASCSECNRGRCGYWATWTVDDWRCH